MNIRTLRFIYILRATVFRCLQIWQCGGQMFDAPCSRVGHIYRKFAPFSSGGFGNYLGKVRYEN